VGVRWVLASGAVRSIIPLAMLATSAASCVSTEPSSDPDGAPPGPPGRSGQGPQGRPGPVRPAPLARRVTERDAGANAAPGPAPTLASDAAAPALRDLFHDEFDRPELGPDWNATSPAWRISQGKLCAQGARNHPVWLRRRLARNARIEFDAESASADGDLKAELWGDGRSAAEGVSYTDATSYLVILGGWRNRFHVLARRDEHAPDRLQVVVDAASTDLRARPVVAGLAYHFKVERRDGKTVRWLVDDIELLSFSDPEPLAGPGHDALAFNDWEVPVCFDNLLVTPLPGE
jgi:hypothetical protein